MSDLQSILQVKIDQLPTNSEPNLNIKAICQAILDKAVAQASVDSATFDEIQDCIDSHNRYESAITILKTVPDSFKDELKETFKMEFDPSTQSHPNVPEGIIDTLSYKIKTLGEQLEDDKIQALQEKAKAEAETLNAYAKAANAVVTANTTTNVKTIQSPFKGAKKNTKIVHADRVAVTTLYDRTKRSTFAYEDNSRIFSSVSKGITDGYKEFDLDALMRNDKIEDRSAALRSITGTIQCNHRLKEKLQPYGMADVFRVIILDDMNTDVVTKSADLFTEFSNVTAADVIKSCNTYCEMSSNADILKTYNQDLMWSRQTVEKSIASPTLLREVLIEMDLLSPQDRTGPMMFFQLMTKMINHSESTRAGIKQAWLYQMGVTDYDGGNIAQFTSDWRNIELFLKSLGEDTSDSLRQYIKAMLQCPNSQFRMHFQTLESVNDAILKDIEKTMQAALSMYRRLTAEGKWTVRSRKEHSAFLQQKKNTEVKKAKAHKAKANLKPDSDKSDSKKGDYKSNLTRKTHDGQGHPIDRTPPKDGEPKKRINPLTKKEEHFCEDSHCQRWGNHATDGHSDWYKKIIAAKEKRKKLKAEESDDASVRSSNTSMRIPTSSEVP